MKQWTENKIGDEGAKKISESLMINTTLTQLNLSCNWNTTPWLKNELCVFDEKYEMNREQYWK